MLGADYVIVAENFISNASRTGKILNAYHTERSEAYDIMRTELAFRKTANSSINDESCISFHSIH